MAPRTFHGLTERAAGDAMVVNDSAARAFIDSDLAYARGHRVFTFCTGFGG